MVLICLLHSKKKDRVGVELISNSSTNTVTVVFLFSVTLPLSTSGVKKKY